MSTPTPTDPREEKPEIVHGFELPSGCNATYLDHWNEFAKFYSEKIGGTADPRDSHAKMLLEFYVEGGFQEFQRLQSTASNLTAEIAGLKGMLKDWLRIGPVTGMSMAQYVVASEAQLATLRAELEAARKELESRNDYIRQLDRVIDDERVADSCINPLEDLQRAIRKLKLDRDTALAAKDAAEKKAGIYHYAFVSAPHGSECLQTTEFGHCTCWKYVALFSNIHIWQEADNLTIVHVPGMEDFRVTTVGATELIEDMTAALTPAPTQEPPAGGVTFDSKWRDPKWLGSAGGVTISNETVGIIPTATTPTEASPDVSALGVEAASHPISTVEKERDHWKATAELHYNARLELERERDRKGGDSSCAPSKEPTHQDSSKCASNSPADVPSEGRGELLPFNLADALAGKPVVTRDGSWRGKIVAAPNLDADIIGDYVAIAVMAAGPFLVLPDGRLFNDRLNDKDLFMLPTEGSGA